MDMENERHCGGCSGCSGDCSGCSGCARELTVTEQELNFLQLLGEVAFLPVARKMGDLEPVYLEEGEDAAPEYSLVLQCLEKKGLVSLDYDKPLKGMDMSRYSRYPIHGSIALTERGQKVLELVEYLGTAEE